MSAVARLAEALFRERYGMAPADAEWKTAAVVIRAAIDKEAAAILAADPELTEALERGLAWQEAEAALPEWEVEYVGNVLGVWSATAVCNLDSKRIVAKGPTPTAALVALTKALSEREQS